VVALNVVKLRKDNYDPRQYLARLEEWKGRVEKGGGHWRVVNDLDRNVAEEAAEAVRLEDLPSDIRAGESAAARQVPSSSPDPAAAASSRSDAQAPGAGTLREFKDASERAYLVQKLRENNWNISKTAEIIDTPRSNLYKKLEQYGIKQEVDG